MLGDLPEAIAAEIAKLKAIIAGQRERLRPDMRELLLFEAAEAGYKAELERLREFYNSMMADRVTIQVDHPYHCPNGAHGQPCICGGAEVVNRIDKAIAALAEASEDTANE